MMECRASDDFEGNLGHQLDACMHSAISQCWGGSVQSRAQNRRRSLHNSSDTPSAHQAEPLGDGPMSSDQSGQLYRSAWEILRCL